MSGNTNAPAPENPELVIRKLNDQITIFSAPFARGGFLPIGGRSTAVTLKDGSLWLIPSHALDPQTLTTIQSLAQGGPGVKHLVAPDREHNMFLTQYQAAFPEAKLYVPQGVKEAWSKKGSGKEELVRHISHVFDGKSPCPFEETTGGEIKSVDFGKSHANEDVAFLHVPTKTLIEADLLFNLPPTEQYSKSKKKSHVPFLSGGLTAGGVGHKRMLWYLVGKDRVAMAKHAKEVAAWDFDNIIPCHGDVIETNGKAVWNELYKWFTEGKH